MFYSFYLVSCISFQWCENFEILIDFEILHFNRKWRGGGGSKITEEKIYNIYGILKRILNSNSKFDNPIGLSKRFFLLYLIEWNERNIGNLINILIRLIFKSHFL